MNKLWIGVIIAIGLGIVWDWIHSPDAKKRMESLPLEGSTYRGKDIPLDEFEKNYFENVNVTKRTYLIDGQEFFIAILDGTANRHAVHDPYYCFVGSGWEIEDEKKISLNHGIGNLLTIQKDGEKREALFWFTNGKSQFASPIRYWLEATLRRFTLGFSGEEPILVVVQPMGSEPVDSGSF